LQVAAEQATTEISSNAISLRAAVNTTRRLVTPRSTAVLENPTSAKRTS
jgi:hypothetical protein